jgi:hypothetical protein
MKYDLQLRHFFFVGLVSLTFHFGFAVLQFIDIHSIAGLMSEKNYFDFVGRANYVRIIGFFASPIMAGQFASLFTLLTLPYFLRIKRRLYLAWILFISSFIILFSATRAAMITFMIGLSIIIIIEQRASLRRMSLYGGPLIVFTTCILLVLDLIPERVLELLTVFSEGPQSVSSINERLQLWTDGINAYQSYGFWGSLVNPNALSGVLADNYYLQLFIQAGPIGPLTVLVLMLAIGIQSVSDNRMEFKYIQTGIIVFMTGLFVGNIPHNLFPLPYFQIPLWTTLGITYAESTSLDLGALGEIDRSM